MNIENKEKREIAPSAPNPLQGEKWMLDGVEIADTTLRQQRLYAQEPNGTWTRPKNGGSWNSF